MPQSSVEELTTRLVAAINTQGHVKDMTVVTEVVTQLEAMTITAEHLKVTRLGKHINTVRRQLNDSNKSLAKRMKKLVKSWQQLLQARTPNGVPPSTPHTSTPTNPLRDQSPLPLHTNAHTPSPPLKERVPSPFKHDASKLTITSSTPQSIKELFTEGKKITNGIEPEASNPAKNRQKLLNLLSKVKKPLSTATPPAARNGSDQSTVLSDKTVPEVVSAKVVSSKFPTVSSDKAVPEIVSSKFPTVSSDKAVPEVVSSKFSTKNFVSIDENKRSNVSEAFLPALKNEECLSLKICLPRSAIARTPQTSRKTIQKKKHKRLKREKIKSLLVSVPLNLVRLKPPLQAKTSEINNFVVSIPIVYYSQRHFCQPGKKIENTPPLELTGHTHTVQKQLPLPVKQPPHKIEVKESEKMDVDVSVSLPVAELDVVKNVPTVAEEESLSGLHKIFNGDCFTRSIPSQNDVTSVMILPYVYIDGVTDHWSNFS